MPRATSPMLLAKELNPVNPDPSRSVGTPGHRAAAPLRSAATISERGPKRTDSEGRLSVGRRMRQGHSRQPSARTHSPPAMPRRRSAHTPMRASQDRQHLAGTPTRPPRALRPSAPAAPARVRRLRVRTVLGWVETQSQTGNMASLLVPTHRHLELVLQRLGQIHRQMDITLLLSAARMLSGTKRLVSETEITLSVILR
jgi:hypothetical protein